jgi:hypothetical protein
MSSYKNRQSDWVDSLLGFIQFMNEYDREGDLDPIFVSYNPLDRNDWQKIYASEGFVRYGFRHGPGAPIEFDVVAVSAQFLIAALSEKDFDWEWLVRRADEYFQIPSCWHQSRLDYRLIFEEAYRAVYENWHDELSSRGIPMPTLEMVDVPD